MTTTTTPDPTELSPEELRDAVRDRYAAAARRSAAQPSAGSCCDSSCCGGDATVDADAVSFYGHEAGQVSAAALAASLGCGNPTALADLQPGQTVLDLGSGSGLDVLLSARRVGPTGIAYGLDMTPEMLDLARRNQAQAGVANARFLQGTIEQVPLPDASVDVIISNCVINLAADKDAVLREAHRLLVPGGSFAVSDIVLLKDLPEPAQHAMRLWTGCIAGALRDTDYLARLRAAGFADPSVEITRTYTRADAADLADQLRDAGDTGMDVDALIDSLDGAVASAFIRAARPA